MKIGSVLPHMGVGTSPETIVQAAQRAEALDFDSAWVAERVLYPVNPRTPYGASPDGSLPDFYQWVFTPLGDLDPRRC